MPRARNSVGGAGLTWKRNGSLAVLHATLATDANSDGKLVEFTLFAAVTTKDPAKYARSQSAWNGSAQSRLRVPSERLITSNPRSTAHSSPAWNAAALPVRPPPSTLMLVILAPGASEWMMPAHAVPWPQLSPCSPPDVTTSSSTTVISTPSAASTQPSRPG